MIQRAAWTLLLSLVLLTGCGGGDPGFVRLRDYENDAGEAAIRHLLPTLPELAPGVPKEYCVMIARDLRPASPTFERRFADTKLLFINGDVLVTEDVTLVPKNPRSGVSPYVLQIAHMHKDSDTAYTVEMGWAYKKKAERRKYVVEKKADQWTVTRDEVLPEPETVE